MVTEDQVPDPNGLLFSPDYKKLYVISLPGVEEFAPADTPTVSSPLRRIEGILDRLAGVKPHCLAGWDFDGPPASRIPSPSRAARAAT